MIPACTSKNSIIDPDLREKGERNEVGRISIVPTPQGSYVVVYMKDQPGRPVYLTTRRERTSPKLFKDPRRLFSGLTEEFVARGVPVEIQKPPDDQARPHLRVINT